MKLMKDVEKDRLKYYSDPSLNAVYRSSLLVSKINNCKTYFSLINHYLIKRGMLSVAVKISPFNEFGKSGDALSFVLNEKKVYTFCLDDLFDKQFVCFQVEFFNSENFYIPYPAVMVNHVFNDAINTVHAFNRILNDPLEMEKIGTFNAPEAAIDLLINKKLDTFIIYQNGLVEIDNTELVIECFSALNKRKKFIKKIPISLPKMSFKKINLSEILGQFINHNCFRGEYVLKVHQPSQILFYGRLFIAIEDRESNSFSGNHSYYDNSSIKEYFSNPVNYKTHPYFPNAKNRIIIYPIMSPSKGNFLIYANIESKKTISSKLLKKYPFSTSVDSLIIDINNLVLEKELSNKIKTFTLVYESIDKIGSPTRINYQLIYGPNIETGLDASINTSLYNDDVFAPKAKKSQVWIQLVNNKGYKSFLGICFLDNITSNVDIFYDVEVDVYDEKGLLETRSFKLRALDVQILNNQEFSSDSPFIWLFVRSNKNNLCLQTYSYNEKSNYASGEHSFGSW